MEMSTYVYVRPLFGRLSTGVRKLMNDSKRRSPMRFMRGRLLTLFFAASLWVVFGGLGCSDDDGGQPIPDGAVDGGDGDGGQGDGGEGDGGGDGGDVDGDLGPRITSVQPSAVACTMEVELLILGEGFEQGSTVTLVNCDTNEEIQLGEGTLTGDTEIRVAVGPLQDCSALQGLYKVVVSGPTEDLESFCTVHLTANEPPTVLTVSPPYAYEGDPNDGVLSDRQVAITGEGFRSTPSVTLVSVADPSQVFECTLVSFISETSLTAVVPSESRNMSPGDYYIYVTNPDLLSGQWLVDTDNDGVGDVEGLFNVTGTPPPDIDSIDPQRPGANDCPLTIEILGSGFTQDSSALLLVDPAAGCPAGTTEVAAGECALPTSCEDAGDPNTCSGSRLVAQLDSCPTQGFYPIRVINADQQYDDYYFLEITESASQHLNDPFLPVGDGLTTGRQRHGAVAGFDATGGSHIYVVGGVDAAGAVLGTVEQAVISIFGEIAGFSPSLQYVDASTPRAENVMVTPRQGHVLVRAGRHIFAIGGASSETFVDPSVSLVDALDTAEVARILGYETVPLVGAPQNMGGKGLPPGSWYYRVSAILPEDGESLGSTEVNIRNTTGVFKVCWQPVSGATAYNIYRSVGADGRSGTTRLLAAGQAGTQEGNRLCFTDDGHGSLLAAPGWLRGSVEAGGSLDVGEWVYRVTAQDGQDETLASYPLTISIADAGQATLRLRWDAPTTDATLAGSLTYNVYRTSVPGQGAGETVLLASGITDTMYVDDGSVVPSGQSAPLGIPPLPPGSLSRWKTVVDGNGDPILLNVPREGARGVAVRVVDGDDQTEEDPTFIYVAGGRTSNDVSDPTVYRDSLERIEVFSDGTLDPDGWILETQYFNHPRVFYALVTNAPAETTPPPPDQPDCLIPDADGDGYISCPCGGDDCDDTDPNVNPGEEEICGDGIDQDCDQGCAGGTDEECPECDPAEWDLDGDGYMAPPCGNDCDDTDPDIHPGAYDYECDGIDQDCDGEDPCYIPIPPPPSDGHEQEGGLASLFHRILGPAVSDRLAARTILPDHVGSSELMDLIIQQDRRAELPPLPDPLPLPPEHTGPIYLVAMQGDESYDNWPGGSTTGTRDMEVCQLDNTGSWDPQAGDYNANYGGLTDCDADPNADLWALQLPSSTRGTPSDVLAHDGLLYAGGVFVFGGASSVTVPDSLVPISTGYRFVFTEGGDPTTDPSGLISNRQNIGGGGFTQARAFFALVRLNGKVFCIGGTTNGLDSLGSVEVVAQ